MSQFKIKLALILGLTCVVLFWILGTPFGGVADEPQYLRNGIYYTLNTFDDAQKTISQRTAFEIDHSSCFAFHPEISASCQKADLTNTRASSTPPQLLFNYPKPWFWLTAWPVFLSNGITGALLARILASLISLTSIFLGIIFWRRENSKLLLSIAASCTPLFVSMLASYNPNSLEIGGTLGLSLLLFGNATKQNATKQNATKLGAWRWFAIGLTSLLTASAKPMSGNFVLFAICVFVISKFFGLHENDKQKRLVQPYLSKIDLYLILIGAISWLYSLWLSKPSFVAAKKGTISTPLYHQYWSATVRFLGLSEKYALENAGIFGWRDTYPAPWMTSVWILLTASLIAYAMYRRPTRVKMFISVMWLGVFFFFPLGETLVLTYSANVGLQTRYLAGYYIAVAITTACFVNLENKAMLNFYIRTSIVMSMIDAIWVYIRFSVGLPGGYPPHIPTIQSLFFGNQYWHPYNSFIYLSLGCLILLGTFTSEKKFQKILKRSKTNKSKKPDLEYW